MHFIFELNTLLDEFPNQSRIRIGDGLLGVEEFQVYRLDIGDYRDVGPRIVMGPYLGALWLWRQKDWRRTEPWHQIMPGLRLGRRPSAREASARLSGTTPTGASL